MSNDETQPVRPDGDATLPPAPSAEPTSPAATTAEPVAAAPAPAARRGFGERFRSLRRSDDGDRTYGLAALIASALAGVIIGGLGLAALQAIGHDGPGDGREMVQRRDGSNEGGPGFDRRRGMPGDMPGGMPGGMPGDMPGDMHGGPPGLPGQVQPTTPPEDDSDG